MFPRNLIWCRDGSSYYLLLYHPSQYRLVRSVFESLSAEENFIALTKSYNRSYQFYVRY